MKHLNTIALALLLSSLSQATSAAPLEKCVGDDGRVYYGDSIPPDVLAKCRSSSEVSKSGLVKGATKPVTDEERKTVQESALKAKESEKLAAEQKRRDLALIDTYTRIEEIDQARDRSLAPTQKRIDNYNAEIKSSQEKIVKLRAQAGDLSRQKKPVPQSLENEIIFAEKNIKTSQEGLAAADKEVKEVTAKYEAEKKRYREIKKLPPAP